LISEIKYISTATIPVVKIISSEKFKNKRVDITMRDHYGDICVNLAKHYIDTYKPFKPLILLLKQIVFFARLNDPYSVSLSGRHIIVWPHSNAGGVPTNKDILQADH